MRSVFISYKYEDKIWKDKVKKWGSDKRFGGNVVIIGKSEDVRQGGTNAVKGHISPKIRGASDVLVLVGNDTHNSTGVEYEVQHAKSSGKNIILVRIPGTTGAAPRSLMYRDMTAFEPNAIMRALNN
uniref:MTH538 TIR-like domain (DUF1863) n=1 Tax=Candidatus Kentrum sp. MB TaxID=2138164 RepID=A0A450X2G2_9GAMM|nr:MAG: MTH538 TIR-like domain (DUF1863) [Candidatus Kentron sp. MB]VFK27857.1 MAG: MTH538 TIR-like domain (DUF1863) [Candidatus Kentron sp. MB]VFK74443.1 MAG: MTH538 TIR-like domain (DUF1863) [Candidatus Kentron sp. MB]